MQPASDAQGSGELNPKPMERRTKPQALNLQVKLKAAEKAGAEAEKKLAAAQVEKGIATRGGD